MPTHSSGTIGRTVARKLRRLLREKRGAALVTFALAVPAIAGVTSMAVESGLWYLAKRGLQNQADAAAQSGAFERAKGNPGTVNAAALNEAVRNGFVNAAPNAIVINNPPLGGSEAGNGGAVEAILTQPQQLLLASYFIPGVTVRARAVAAVQVTGTACVLALHPSMNGAVTNQGSALIDMSGCSVAANSTSSSAIDITGSGTLLADSLWTVGNYTQGGSSTLTLAKPPVVNAWAIEDPYGSLTIPPLGACDHNSATYSGGTATIDPGIYCNGIGFGANADVTLNPGTYYIDQGDFAVTATARLRCACIAPGDGVTFVLTSSGGASAIGTVTINGGADVLLNAPSDPADPYTGVIFYQDPRAPSGGKINKFNGGPLMSLTGAVYMPNQQVQWSGNNSPSAPTCTQIIARQVVFIGNATIRNSGCPAAGVQPLNITGVRIVE